MILRVRRGARPWVSHGGGHPKAVGVPEATRVRCARRAGHQHTDVHAEAARAMRLWAVRGQHVAPWRRRVKVMVATPRASRVVVWL